MPDDENSALWAEFMPLWREYEAEFGATVSTFHVFSDPDLARRMIPEMRRALDGEREELTDEEFGLDVPAEAES